MNFNDRRNLKTIRVGKYSLKQANASFWHTGKDTVSFPIMYIAYSEYERAVPWRGIIESGVDRLEFHSAELDKLCSVLERMEKIHPIS